MTRTGQPLDIARGQVDLGHGAGGRAMAQLIEQLFQAHFDSPALKRGHDAALLAPPGGRLVMCTDSFVVSPVFFPGGDIGALAVNGTVNDLAMGGGVPLYLTAAFILEEGFPLADLKRIATSMARAAREAGVDIVSGDTKVVERGHGDGIYITTAGVGVVPEGIDIGGDRARPGDVVLINGPIGDHGIAIMSKRENLSFGSDIESDCQPLGDLVGAMLAAVPSTRVLRDPTRGGLGSTLNEIAQQSGIGIELDEAAIPVRREVQSACELLGLDPLYVANEGKLIAVCPPDDAERLLAAMKAHPRGRQSAIIGRIVEDERRFVRMVTGFGGTRMVDWIAGEQLPRIC
ncbi:hydrogenase expression/formation protein HypE [Zhengella mangrovi]|uniref:Hydrogenase expression/formation protein HypE n=1 Tax=Zhengella mangrovi TaxID=1982044 RepID=A0A2G1QQI2_9HYPH|nr:hydrogenase expression/formation protein HypE [Zhengella mangrovi]PHP67739.1 hydrogenase expression/formation protein HypE [Zhengella mangrovi]